MALVVIAAALLIGLLVAEHGRDPRRILLFKTPLSCLFVLAAVIQPHAVPSYWYCIFAGLILGLVGDVSLALPGDKWFRIGLAAFLAGHVLYVAAFVGLTGIVHWLSPVQALFILIGAAVFRMLRPHLGRMLLPVLLYVLVITVMLGGAWAAFSNPAVSQQAAWFIFVGAVLFYLSDLFVARDRFLSRGFANRLLGLPLYYAGQFLIAFSTGLVG